MVDKESTGEIADTEIPVGERSCDATECELRPGFSWNDRNQNCSCAGCASWRAKLCGNIHMKWPGKWRGIAGMPKCQRFIGHSGPHNSSVIWWGDDGATGVAIDVVDPKS